MKSPLKIKSLFLLVFFSFLVGCSTINNSPMALKSFQPIYQVNPIWSQQVGSGPGDYKLKASYADGKIFTVDKNGKLMAIAVKTGKIFWALALNTIISAGTGSNSNYVAVVSQKGNLFVINAATGKLIWSKAISDTALAAPVIYKNTILVKTIDGNLTAYVANTGDKKWSYSNGIPALTLQGSSQPAVIGNRVIAGFADGHVLAFNLNSGQVLWNRTLAFPRGMTIVQRLVDIDATPIIKNGSVYVASYQGKIGALNLTNGRFFWEHRFSSNSGIAATNTQVFASDVNGIVWAFDSDSGGIDWRQNELRNQSATAPAVMNKTIVVGDGRGYLNWLNINNGAFVARIQTPGSINTKPLVVNNTVYVLTINGYLSAYQLR